MSFGTIWRLLRPERRVAEVLRYKSTSSHSFPKSNCSQEALVTRLSTQLWLDSIRGSSRMERFGAFGSQGRTVYLQD